MRKNQNGKKDESKKKTALKTGSDATGSTKPEPKQGLNDSIQNVTVNKVPETETLSNESPDEPDYPPEFANYIATVVIALREELGLKEDEELPEGAVKEWMAEILADVGGMEALLEMLQNGEMPGLEEEPEESTELTDADRDIQEILTREIDQNGFRIVHDIELKSDAKPVTVIIQLVKIAYPENLAKLDLYLRVRIPAIAAIPIDEVKKHRPEESKIMITNGDKNAYEIEVNTYLRFAKIAKACGHAKEFEPIRVDEDNLQEKISEHIANCKTNQPTNKPKPGDAKTTPDDGYYADKQEYWYSGKCYHEKETILLEIPAEIDEATGEMKGHYANLDAYPPYFSPCDISQIRKYTIESGKKVLPSNEKFSIFSSGYNVESFERLTEDEEAFVLAREYASKFDVPGYCVVMMNGKFKTIVESIHNPATNEYEHLLVPFNAYACLPNHHKCCGLMVADVGNMPMQTAIRYRPNKIFDWHKRVEQEIKSYRITEPDFDPYKDAYDVPFTNPFFSDDDN